MPVPELHTDRILFTRIAEGDEAAFETVFRQYSASFLPFLNKLLGTEQLAQDVIQETFYKLWVSRAQLKTLDNPGGWLYTIMSRAAYQQLRTETRYQKKMAAAMATTLTAEPDNTKDLELKKIREVIEASVKELPEGRRKIFRLVKLEGHSRREAAEILGIAENTVKNQLAAAMDQVQQALKNAGYESLPAILIISLLG